MLAEHFCYSLQDKFSFHCSCVGLNPHVLVWAKDSHVSGTSKHLREEQFLEVD